MPEIIIAKETPKAASYHVLARKIEDGTYSLFAINGKVVICECYVTATEAISWMANAADVDFEFNALKPDHVKFYEYTDILHQNPIAEWCIIQEYDPYTNNGGAVPLESKIKGPGGWKHHVLFWDAVSNVGGNIVKDAEGNLKNLAVED